MKAGIIAAGEGSRLKSEGITLPKPLVSVDGVPLIERLIDSFIRCGITEIVCIVNEYSLEVKKFVESKKFSIPIQFVVKTTPSSMHSLFVLSPYLKDGQFLLSTVDSIFNGEELSRLLKYAQQHQSVDGILAVTNFVDDEKPLYVEMDKLNQIVSFGSNRLNPQPLPTSPSPNGRRGGAGGDEGIPGVWVTGGLYIFSPRIFNEMDAVLRKGIERLRNFLEHLLREEYRLEGFPFSKIIDVDHIHDIAAAEDMLRSK